MTEQPGTDSAPQLSLQERLEAKFDLGGGEEETPNENAQTAETQEADEQTTEQTETTQDDSEDFDFEGVPLRLPKEAASKLKSAVEGYKDYTKKTQELAENRRVLAQQAQLVQEQQQFQASISTELAQFHQLEQQIQQYRKLDWATMSMEETMRYRAILDQIKDQKEELGKAIQGKGQEFQQKQAQTRKQLADAQAKAVKAAIPNWSDKTAGDVIKAAQAVGFTDADLGNNFDPRFVVLAHKAAQWDALQASKPSVTQRANSAPPVLKPGAANTQPSKAIDTMNYRKALKKAPDNASRNALIFERLKQKV
jgi:hypothetical protein